MPKSFFANVVVALAIVLVVGSVIALATSALVPRVFDAEISPSTYRSIALDLQYRPYERPLIHQFMADGKITYSELRKLNNIDQAHDDKEVPLKEIKEQLKR